MNVQSPIAMRLRRADEEQRRLLGILKDNSDMPLPLTDLAEMMGRTRAQIETVVEELEGPVESDAPGAFVHFWRLTDKAVFIP